MPADIGISHFGIMDYAGQPRAFEGEWTRAHPGPFAWGSVESAPGTYFWERVDGQVRFWQQQRVAILATIWPYAEWDQKICHANDPGLPSRMFSVLTTRVYAPCDKAAYAKWLSSLVERYDGDGVNDMPDLLYPVRHWEILNEPEMQPPRPTLNFFQGSPADYLDLLKLSFKTIKAADPKGVVLPAGKAGMQPEFNQFWEPIMLGAQGSFDIGNIHSLGSSDDFFASEYRDRLEQLGYKNMPFFITEAQAPNGGGPGQPPSGPDGQARAIFRGYSQAFVNGAQVIFKVSAGSSGIMEQAFLTMAKTVGTFSTVHTLGPNVVRFDMPDKRQVYALWDGARLPAEVSGRVKVVRYSGEESTQDSTQVVATSPILVVTGP